MILLSIIHDIAFEYLPKILYEALGTPRVPPDGLRTDAVFSVLNF